MVVVLHLLHGGGQGVDALHNVNYLPAVELVPGRCYNGRVGVELAEHRARGDDLAVGGGVGAAEDDNVGVVHLIVEELAEVADIHAAASRVNDRDLCADLAAGHACDGLCNVGELAHAARLDEDAVGVILLDDLLKRGGEVADEGAADAAGVHLGYLNARVAQEAAVNGDLAELVLDEDELFVFIALRDELADERGLARSEEAGKNVYLSQGYYLLNNIQVQIDIIPRFLEFANLCFM